MIRVFAVLFISMSVLDAFSDFDYTLDVSTKSVVKKEAIFVSLKIDQKKYDEVMHFEFFLPKSDNYSFDLLESKESKDGKDRTHIKSQYVLYPLKEGSFEIVPQLTIKRASKEELKKFVTGSADELMYMQTRNSTIGLSPFKFDVKELKKDVELVGDYSLKSTNTLPSKINLNLGEQVNISYVLSGNGYKPTIKSVLKAPVDVSLFLDKDYFDKKLFHKITFRYALIADKDMKIEKSSILAYSPKTKKYYRLEIAPLYITVNRKEIKNSPKNEKNHIFSWQKFLNYLLLFLSGFFIQKLFKKFRENSLTSKKSFIQKVDGIKEPKELLKLLLAYDNKTYRVQIRELEEIIYEQKRYKLSSIKKSIIDIYYKESELDILR